ncbi:MAG TPA: FG-GAP-like repeat-containing protein [Bacteroidia bacterium]|jgi:hypothetical protein|nr:FG-GAP-like repeat-containing protein [Bacteroidia bacterium]
MKKLLILSSGLLSISVCSFAQTATFSDQSGTITPTTAFHSGDGVGIADMNGDFKDDIVRAQGNATMYIEFQNAPNQMFTETSYPNYIGDPWGMCIGDVNNDGYNDVFWGDFGNTIVLTRTSATTYSSNNWATSTTAPWIFVQGCNFFDVNNDHCLDGFICNDDASPNIYVGNGLGGWYNDNTLMPLSQYPVLMDPDSNSGNYASIWTDVNNDGLTDCMITHCRQGVTQSTDPRRIDQIFINNGNGTYTQDITNWTGLRDGAQGWSTAWGDVDDDGDMDAFVLNYDVNSKLMINNGSGVFNNYMGPSGIASTTTIFGENATFQDFDNDGFLDLMISGSNHLVYMNNHNNTFTALSNPFPYAAHQITAHAVGDLNGDGFLDVYASYCDIYQSANSGRDDKVWMNTTNNGNHWIKFNLIGGATNGYSNRNGVGASVKIYGPWGVQIREVRSGEGYGIQNSLTLHFGLGANTQIDSATITWPSGIVDHLGATPADNTYSLTEGQNATNIHGIASNPVTIGVYPNPAVSGNISLHLNNFAQYGLNNLSLSIYDANGKLVYTEAALHESIIYLDQEMAKGVYIIELKKGDTRVATEKMVIQ